VAAADAGATSLRSGKGSYKSGTTPKGARFLFAENAHFGLVAFRAVYVHGQVLQVVDQLFQVFRFDLGKR
jgi:hypothetical protein